MNRFNIKLLLIIFISVVLAGYFIYEFRGYLMGPKIIIDVPANGGAIRNSYLEVRGQALNVASLSLNGRPIYTDEAGNFKEGLLLARGYNIIELTAIDKFGRIKKEKREIVLE